MLCQTNQLDFALAPTGLLVSSKGKLRSATSQHLLVK
jgi:hypothetical protein